MTQTLNFLSAGAAQALVKALQPLLTQQTGAASTGRFGAVGAMKEAFDAAEPCDLIILTEALIGAMEAAGTVRAGSARPLGRVRTGVAVRRGDARPEVGTPDALRAALLAADSIYFPDPVRATAGIHFASVMRDLGVHDELAPRFRTFPNGATAMRELAAATTPQPIGCTQVTEILYTEGVDLIALLPPQFELTTVYTAAVTTRATEPELAARMVDLITGPASAELRQRSGFEA
jgi:molybdate transport system substrate-binding protein